MEDIEKTYGSLNEYIGLHRTIIIQESNGEMNISKSSNGGFHLFLTPNTGFTYGFGLDALKAAVEDFKLLLDKNIEERKNFVLASQLERLNKELKTW